MTELHLHQKQHIFINQVIQQCLELVDTNDHCAVLWGSRLFGYATNSSDYDINVIHAGTKKLTVAVTSDEHKYDLTFVPRRHLFREYANSPEQLQLVPLGKVISTSSGDAHCALDMRRAAPEWREDLCRDVKIDFSAAIHPRVGQTPSAALGVFLRQVYAYMLREHLLARESTPIETLTIVQLAGAVGGEHLARDVSKVISFRGRDVLSIDRKNAIFELFDRLMTRDAEPA